MSWREEWMYKSYAEDRIREAELKREQASAKNRILEYKKIYDTGNLLAHLHTIEEEKFYKDFRLTENDADLFFVRFAIDFYFKLTKSNLDGLVLARNNTDAHFIPLLNACLNLPGCDTQRRFKKLVLKAGFFITASDLANILRYIDTIDIKDDELTENFINLLIVAMQIAGKDCNLKLVNFENVVTSVGLLKKLLSLLPATNIYSLTKKGSLYALTSQHREQDSIAPNQLTLHNPETISQQALDSLLSCFQESNIALKLENGITKALTLNTNCDKIISVTLSNQKLFRSVIEDALPHFIQQFPRLTELYCNKLLFQSDDIKKAFLRIVTQKAGIKKLQLTECQLNDTDLDSILIPYLMNNIDLEEIHLTGNHFSHVGFKRLVAALIRGNRSLKIISHEFVLNDAALQETLKRNRSIEQLAKEHSAIISELQQIPAVLTNIFAVETLQIYDTKLQDLYTRAQKLRNNLYLPGEEGIHLIGEITARLRKLLNAWFAAVPMQINPHLKSQCYAATKNLISRLSLSPNERQELYVQHTNLLLTDLKLLLSTPGLESDIEKHLESLFNPNIGFKITNEYRLEIMKNYVSAKLALHNNLPNAKLVNDMIKFLRKLNIDGLEVYDCIVDTLLQYQDFHHCEHAIQFCKAYNINLEKCYKALVLLLKNELEKGTLNIYYLYNKCNDIFHYIHYDYICTIFELFDASTKQAFHYVQLRYCQIYIQSRNSEQMYGADLESAAIYYLYYLCGVNPSKFGASWDDINFCAFNIFKDKIAKSLPEDKNDAENTLSKNITASKSLLDLINQIDIYLNTSNSLITIISRFNMNSTTSKLRHIRNILVSFMNSIPRASIPSAPSLLNANVSTATEVLSASSLPPPSTSSKEASGVTQSDSASALRPPSTLVENLSNDPPPAPRASILAKSMPMFKSENTPSALVGDEVDKFLAAESQTEEEKVNIMQLA